MLFTHKKYTIFFSCLLWLSITGIYGCKKYVTVPAPLSSLTSVTVFNSNSTAQSAIAGMYSYMANTSTAYRYYITLLNGMSADELYYYPSNTYDQFKNNAIPTSDTYNSSFWSDSYSAIYNANALIEGINNATAVLPDSTRRQAVGEAKFIRAYCHFYLVNLFGSIPLITTTNVDQAALAPQSDSATVYNQVINDLKDAQGLLGAAYPSTGERTRINVAAATAMLARVYLYTGNYAAAQAQATAVINNTSLYSLQTNANINSVFIKNNTEAILQLYSYNNNGYTFEGNAVVPSSTTPRFYLRTELLNAFEAGDKRRTAWVNAITYSGTTYYYPYKYKLITTNTTANAEYPTLLRLAEQYLIRAEAEAKLNNLSAAITDLNTIRTRAGLANTTATTQNAVLAAVYHENQVEFFCEWAHRWFDLKRTGSANAVLGAEKPTTWNAIALLNPLPATAVKRNPNLIPTPGYQYY